MTERLRADLRVAFLGRDRVQLADPYRPGEAFELHSLAYQALTSPRAGAFSKNELAELRRQLGEAGLVEGSMAERARESAATRMVFGATLVLAPPEEPTTLARRCRLLLTRAERKLTNARRDRVRGILSPHTNLSITGDCAAAAYALVTRDEWPDVFVLLGTSHYARRPALLTRDVMTCMGRIPCDRELVAALRARSTLNLESDPVHALVEHSWQTDLPLLQTLAGERGRSMRIVVVLVGNASLAEGRRLGRLLGDLQYEQGKRLCVVASGDLTHVGVGYPWKPPWRARLLTVADLAERVARFDHEALEAVVHRRHGSFVERAETSGICARAQVAALLEFADHDGETVAYQQVLNGKRLGSPPRRRWDAANDRLFSVASVAFRVGGPQPARSVAPIRLCPNTVVTKAGDVLHFCDGKPFALTFKVVRELARGHDSIESLRTALSSKRRRLTLDEVGSFLESASATGLLHTSTLSGSDAQARFERWRRSVPFYAGYPERLDAAPFIDSKTVRRAWPSFTARGAEARVRRKVGVHRRRSSGSSAGESTQTVIERTVFDERAAAENVLGRSVILRSRCVSVNRPENLNLAWRPRDGIRMRFWRESRNMQITPGPDPSAVSDATWDEVIAAIARADPEYLEGDPAYLAGLARRCLTHGAKPKSLLGVITSHSYCWRLYADPIERAFGVRVQNVLATSDVGNVGMTCADGALHLLETKARLEVLDRGRPVAIGAIGALVVTTLDSELRPLVRYVNGDLLRFVSPECRCGRPFRVVEYEGRIRHVLEGSRGRFVTYRDVDRAVGASPGLRYFVLRERGANVALELVASHRDLVDAGALRARVEDCLGRTITLRWRESFGIRAGKLLAMDTVDRSERWYRRFLDALPLRGVSRDSHDGG
jgi:AmmeMemoRadiSam system protein B